MKNILTIICLISINLSMSQTLRKKRILLNLEVSHQKVTENEVGTTLPVFEHSNHNIDYHLKFGRYLLRQKMVIGLGINIRSVNATRFVERGEPTVYITSQEFQLGAFVRYTIFNEIFIETTFGFFGLVPGAGYFLPATSFGSVTKFGPVTKYKFGVGYSFHLWHFLAVEPNISFLNEREIYRGKGAPSDTVGQLSFGLGIAFKL
ncbi:MAG: hypothetical protein AB8B59_13445 [Maribacter sp.]